MIRNNKEFKTIDTNPSTNEKYADAVSLNCLYENCPMTIPMKANIIAKTFTIRCFSNKKIPVTGVP